MTAERSSRFPQLTEETVGAALLARVRSAPDAVATVICSAQGEDRAYTARELLALAAAFGDRYADRALPKSQGLIAICLHQGADLHAAFFGAVLRGHIPSIIAPPSPRMEHGKYIRSFMRMMEHLSPDLVVTDGEVLQSLRALAIDELPADRLMQAADDRDPDRAEELDLETVPAAAASAADIAFLQHSSGTTGLQKGVALGHRSVLNQVRSYSRALDLSGDDVVASWLPLYHDMGLIACFVLPLLTGIPLVEMSPFEWVNRPALLAEKIERYGATLCWLPNFAYSFLAKSLRDEQVAACDFGSVRAFINCSEPVMAATHREFARRFSVSGVDASKLTACYAMAENVFAVTQSPLGKPASEDTISRQAFERDHRAVPPDGDDATLTLVSNGPPIDGVEVRVMDDDGSPCPERQVGEIWLNGTSLFSGYFGRDDLTAEAFADGWYKTGDLGYLAGGELFVTGRKKDLIIIQGRNFYPNDLETAVAEVEGVINGRVVTFGESDESSGTEKLVVIAETRATEPAEVGRINLAIRAQISQSFDCTVGAVHLVPPRWMIKSSSGKVARPDNRRKYAALLKA